MTLDERLNEIKNLDTLTNCDFPKLKYTMKPEKKNVTGFMALSKDKKHRYYYYEDFENGISKNVIFIMFNPSTVSVDKDDPTIRNCRIIAQKTYGSMEIINIFSERNPKVTTLNSEDNKVNMNFITEFLNNRENVDVVIAWGYGKEEKFGEIIAQVESLLQNNPKYKITVKKKVLSDIATKDRHPAPNAWSHLGGFKNSAELNPW